MRKILAVFAHPDDEVPFSGTFAHYARQGAQVALITTTKGEAGEISDPTLAAPENLGAARETELRCAAELIGIADLHFLGYCDSGMAGTPENESPTAFIRADPDDILIKMVGIIRRFQPQVLITFEPNGWYGHPDHIAAGKYATQAFSLAGDPLAYPDAGAPWQPARLYHAAFLRSSFKVIADYAESAGLELPDFEAFKLDEPDPLEEQITHTLDVRAYVEMKNTAARCHRTQFDEDNLFFNAPPDILRKSMGYEHFIQVNPRPDQISEPIPDLFAGLSL